MSIWDIIAIGVALSMDACALTIANCTVYKNLNHKKQWAMPVTFAIFQGVMPILGFFVGSIFAKYLQSIGGFLVAGVFYLLCGKILYDIIKDKEKNGKVRQNLSYALILIQAIATSVDALIIGVTLSFSLTFSIFVASSVIAVTTFILVAVAMVLGKILGSTLGKYAEWAGAGILFILATKELVIAIINVI